jgi:hypothetical protein
MRRAVVIEEEGLRKAPHCILDSACAGCMPIMLN